MSVATKYKVVMKKYEHRDTIEYFSSRKRWEQAVVLKVTQQNTRAGETYYAYSVKRTEDGQVRRLLETKHRMRLVSRPTS